MVTVSFMSFLVLGFVQGRSLKFGDLNRANPHVLRDDVKIGQMIRHTYQCPDCGFGQGLPPGGKYQQSPEGQTGIFRPHQK